MMPPLFPRFRPLLLVALASSQLSAANGETDLPLSDLPDVPPGFKISLFAREPLVRNPCSLAFDARGRMFVGMGPQYRNPTPQTPPDQIVILTDRDGDGTADHSHLFATGFNCIQGLAWHGRDLWVANAPDLTIMRDLDGDDRADEYVRVFTDLGNLEHAVHGLNWAPDGKLYLTKGNSKGVNTTSWKNGEPWRVAPKPFRELAGVPGPPGAPDFPPPQSFTPEQYRPTWQDPADDWGRMGGVLRCDDLGANLEIVARGLRNPYGMASDDQFNWLGTDQDQTEGDRLYMPFFGADFGWSHAWSTHWTGENHPPTVPVSGPVYPGSGTGVVWADSPSWPEPFRKVWLINDWLLKTTHVYRPSWKGALLQPEGGAWENLVSGKQALYRPVDMGFGADGSLYLLGWGRGYGVERDANGAMKNEGRIFRLLPETAALLPPPDGTAFAEMTPAQLQMEFDSLLPVRRIDASDELVRRGDAARQVLTDSLATQTLTAQTETWTLWTLARALAPDTLFSAVVSRPQAPFNRRLQSLRILGHRRSADLPNVVETALSDPESRIRFAAVQAVHQAKFRNLARMLEAQAERETDRLVQFAIWRALRDLLSETQLRTLLPDDNPRIRAAALLALLDLQVLPDAELSGFAGDPDTAVRTIALLALGKPAGGASATPAAGGLPDFFPVKNPAAASGRLSTPAILAVGQVVYTDRPYRFKEVPSVLSGAFMIRPPNEDDNSTHAQTLTFQLPLDATVLVAHDTRIPQRPLWLEAFADTDLTVQSDDATYRLWAREFPAGAVALGGNVRHPMPGKSNYFVVIQPKPLTGRSALTTAGEVMAALPKANPGRGEGLFFLSAACATCHRIGQRGINFGPDLTNLGDRMEARFIVQSLLEPSAVITEGYSAHAVEAGGASYFGMLLATGKILKLGLAGGTTVDLPADTITKHETLPVSPMPPQGALLSPQQAADITAWLMTQKSAGVGSIPAAPMGWQTSQQDGRLVIRWQGKPMAEFGFDDPQILRPFFANLHTPEGVKVTRNHPPVPGQDATDHADMHPGFWLGFGDLNGHDFWRNKARIQHVKFARDPVVSETGLAFSQESRFVTYSEQIPGSLTNHISITKHPHGFHIDWEAEIKAGGVALVFGDQEEMGFGIRMAGALTEKNGGIILNSGGLKSAAKTWGQPAAWCDYSGELEGRHAGITLFASPQNFRVPWWHTRDYGLLVANPFAPLAFKQGKVGGVTLAPRETLPLKFSALIHSGETYHPASAYDTLFKP